MLVQMQDIDHIWDPASLPGNGTRPWRSHRPNLLSNSVLINFCFFDSHFGSINNRFFLLISVEKMAIASNRESIIISKTNDQFDTNYPNSLSGIINEFEYQRSISNINQVAGKSICSTFTIWIIVIVGIFYLTFNLTMAFSNPTFGRNIDPRIFFIFLLVCNIPAAILNLIREAKLSKVINQESEKYARRLPISCTWRLGASSLNHLCQETVRPIIPLLLNHFQFR
ncbi:unnamed protein product [Adineta steineri]|uniref:Uncharacterized protein n=1 Tax=Adineta steineri TaxID=433720 RepID=A0A813WNK2_9BILA|nr:unnamed protein product [Adineta steineri]CAF1478295.1 unnamed protein product [Adineta steineri]CAF1480904.1 unnamed protein product [Adineta steineri]